MKDNSSPDCLPQVPGHSLLSKERVFSPYSSLIQMQYQVPREDAQCNTHVYCSGQRYRCEQVLLGYSTLVIGTAP